MHHFIKQPVVKQGICQNHFIPQAYAVVDIILNILGEVSVRLKRVLGKLTVVNGRNSVLVKIKGRNGYKQNNCKQNCKDYFNTLHGFLLVLEIYKGAVC